MNWQMEFLRNLIASASDGNDAAIDLLRDVCRGAADRAPAVDLLQIAQFLYDLRSEAAQRHIAGN
jgi:hypothetical protein